MATSRPNTYETAKTSSTTAPTSPSPSLKHTPILKRNAFTALKPPKRKRSPPPSTPASDPARNTTSLGRNGLGAYISAPESFPTTRVIYHTAKFVLINDLFPKSSIHLLLLPRDPHKQRLHPFEAFEDAAFLADVRLEAAKAKTLAAKELKRRFGKFSAMERRREALLEEEEDDDDADDADADVDVEGPGKAVDREAPNKQTQGRDWEKEILVGVHAVPSMNHLHVHILSRDRYSECLKHRKHYNSFATGFLVSLEDFPLDGGDRQRWPGRAGFLHEGLKCWRCGRDFGNKFARLKEHLEEEFEAWKME